MHIQTLWRKPRDPSLRQPTAGRSAMQVKAISKRNTRGNACDAKALFRLGDCDPVAGDQELARSLKDPGPANLHSSLLTQIGSRPHMDCSRSAAAAAAGDLAATESRPL
jgi:hypothetical protein